ncbi:MAG: glycosyltransferase family 4 protein [Acidobacteria bacterium]|nr:glycosyltransferase family 4 protein [Acidobacteriota bacterium]
MRLLIAEQWPRFAGGSERMSLSLGRHARAHGCEIWLAYEQPGDMLAAYEQAGIRTMAMPIRPLAARRPGAAWRAVRSLRRLVRREQIDLVFTSQVPLVPALAAAVFGTRARTVVHLGLVYDFPSPIFQRGMRAIDLGIAPSDHTAEGWRARGWPAGTLQVIENGVDIMTFSPGDGRDAARRRLGLPPAVPLVAYVGRLTAAKGVFTLAEAFAAYRRRGGSARLVFAGAAPGDEAMQLAAFAHQAGMADDVLAVWPPLSTPEDLYRAADLVVVPSEWDEPFGLAPLESAACGTLAIVSDRGRLPDFVRAVGPCAVTRAGDVDDVSTCLLYWLAERERREAAAQRVHEDVVRRFGFSACGDAYLQAFSRMVAA